MDTDGGNVRQLTHNSYEDDIPSWSPDGEKIVFSSDRDGDFAAFVMDTDGDRTTGN